ncbi:MAG TPA: glutamine synthetase family protein, partial [Aggregatilineales bacterium]|nr:glutamine synthetase family protein [Aggregatilineales bacterium]
MASLSESASAVIEQVRSSRVHYIDLQFTDVTGLVKTVQIPARQIESALMHGVWFDGSAIEGFARIAESDMYLRPDPSTFAVLPWENGRIGRLMCDVYTPFGEASPSDPRGVLRRAVALARQMGYQYWVTPELEFYLFRSPVDLQALHADDQSSYFDTGPDQSVLTSIEDALEAIGIRVEAGHHEVGAGQYELDFEPLEALSMADAILTARLAIKSIAQHNGHFATFMPKPLAGIAGSGMHVHQTLLDAAGETNAFAGPSSDLSPVGRSFVAGQLEHARGMCAV